jgi:hypothetical protein
MTREMVGTDQVFSRVAASTLYIRVPPVTCGDWCTGLLKGRPCGMNTYCWQNWAQVFKKKKRRGGGVFNVRVIKIKDNGKRVCRYKEDEEKQMAIEELKKIDKTKYNLAVPDNNNEDNPEEDPGQ